MKKYILSFAILAFCIVLSCRSKEVVPSTPDIPDTLLLKTLSVKGASEVKIDHVRGTIQVTLPESYNLDSINLNFTLQQDVFLNYYDLFGRPKNITNLNNPEKPNYQFNYAGMRPLSINVQKKYGFNPKDYLIYVNQINKKLQIAIEKIDSIFSISDDSVKFKSAANFHLKITNNNGTFPNYPNLKNTFVLLKKVGKNEADTAFLEHGYTNFGFEVEKYIPFEDTRFNLELVDNGSRQVLKENFTFVRKKPQPYFTSFGIFEIIKGVKIKGSIFLPKKKYSLKFYNDYLENSVVIDAHFDNTRNLSISSLSSLSAGSYIVEILENDIILNKRVINIGKNRNASAIQTIFIPLSNKYGYGGNESYSTPYNKFKINAGELIELLPLYYYSRWNSNITPDELEKVDAPKLQLVNKNNNISLNPTKKVYNWSVAALDVVYFQYTIPKSTASGFYEAQLVYPDGRESLKYWNKIEIK